MGTLETRIKEPIFIRTLRLKFNFFNFLNKNPPEVKKMGQGFFTGFLCSEFLRIFKSSSILIRMLRWHKRLNDF